MGNTLTVAIRYSLVRRQFKNIGKSSSETQLLNYQTQQMKIFPLLATMWAYSYSIQHVRGKYDAMVEGINRKDFSLLDLLHHYTSGFKSVYSQVTFDSIVSLR